MMFSFELTIVHFSLRARFPMRRFPVFPASSSTSITAVSSSMSTMVFWMRGDRRTAQALGICLMLVNFSIPIIQLTCSLRQLSLDDNLRVSSCSLVSVQRFKPLSIVSNCVLSSWSQFRNCWSDCLSCGSRSCCFIESFVSAIRLEICFGPSVGVFSE